MMIFLNVVCHKTFFIFVHKKKQLDVRIHGIWGLFDTKNLEL